MENISISYAIMCCNEYNETIRLIDILLKYRREQDEIVVLYDDKGDPRIWEYLIDENSNVNLVHRTLFKNNFALWRNKLKKLCSKDYIFFIDADEFPHENLIKNLPKILKENSKVDLFYVPRINTVEGIEKSDIEEWNWKVNEDGWINFPDVQGRILKNDKKLIYVNDVHEVVQGAHYISVLPLEEEFCLYHPKTIERQRLQNKFYSKL